MGHPRDQARIGVSPELAITVTTTAEPRPCLPARVGMGIPVSDRGSKAVETESGGDDGGDGHYHLVLEEPFWDCADRSDYY